MAARGRRGRPAKRRENKGFYGLAGDDLWRHKDWRDGLAEMPAERAVVVVLGRRLAGLRLLLALAPGGSGIDVVRAETAMRAVSRPRAQGCFIRVRMPHGADERIDPL